MLRIGKAVSAYFLTVFLSACGSSSSHSPDDVDICADRCGKVGSVICGNCEYGYICNSDNYCVEMTNDNLPIEEQPDTDMLSCPSMSNYNNMKAAGFPLKDADGRITFCRPGCDTPTENDPQCVRNIWESVNWEKYQDYKQGIFDPVACYPWPCEMPEMDASTVVYNECDRRFIAGGYDAEMASLYDLKLQNGKVGILMGNLRYSLTLEYDVAEDTFIAVGYSGHATGYSHGRFILYATGEDYANNDGAGLGNTFILSAEKNAKGYRYEAIYDDTQHMAAFSRPPIVGEKWVILNVDHRATNTIEVVYAKVGEWQWHDLIEGKVGEGNIVGDRACFATTTGHNYVCDLEKLPFSPATDCLQIDRPGEHPAHPRLNEENNDQLAYFSGAGTYGLTLVDLSKEEPSYTLLPLTSFEPLSNGIGPDQFRGNTILYIESFATPEGSYENDYKACFYRIDLMKNFCSPEMESLSGRYDQAFNSFDGHYHLWKDSYGPIATLRDMDCYCAKKGYCPLADDPSSDDEPVDLDDANVLNDADTVQGICGNGIVEGGEQCDTRARNGEPGHFCTSACVNLGEQQFGRIADKGRSSLFYTGSTINFQRTLIDRITDLEWQLDISGTYSWQDAYEHCEKLLYAQHDDWSLPTPHELLSLVNHDTYGPAAYGIFPDTPAANFWTSLREIDYPSYAWYVEFDTGDVSVGAMTYTNHVRCVRRLAPPVVLSERFVQEVRPDGRIVMRDERTRLDWTGEPPQERMYFQNAKDYCAALIYGGYSDWALPGLNDLISLADYSRYDPASGFPGLPAGDYIWSDFPFPEADWFRGVLFLRLGVGSFLIHGMPDATVLCVRPQVDNFVLSP